MAKRAGSVVEARGAVRTGRRKWSPKALAGMLVGAIIVCECLLAYRFVAGGDSTVDSEARKAAVPAEPAEQREVDLGKFSLREFDFSANTPLAVEFHLIGIVAADPSERDADGRDRARSRRPPSDRSGREKQRSLRQTFVARPKPFPRSGDSDRRQCSDFRSDRSRSGTDETADLWRQPMRCSAHHCSKKSASAILPIIQQ